MKYILYNLSFLFNVNSINFKSSFLSENSLSVNNKCNRLNLSGYFIVQKNPVLYNLFWETTLRCNAFCKHCGSRAGGNINTNNELTTEEIKNAFASIAKKYDASKILINVTGGEPLVRQDLFEVMKFATDLGFNWGMTTNGMLINDEIIQQLQNNGIK